MSQNMTSFREREKKEEEQKKAKIKVCSNVPW